MIYNEILKTIEKRNNSSRTSVMSEIINLYPDATALFEKWYLIVWRNPKVMHNYRSFKDLDTRYQIGFLLQFLDDMGYKITVHNITAIITNIYKNSDDQSYVSVDLKDADNEVQRYCVAILQVMGMLDKELCDDPNKQVETAMKKKWYAAKDTAFKDSE